MDKKRKAPALTVGALSFPQERVFHSVHKVFHSYSQQCGKSLCGNILIGDLCGEDPLLAFVGTEGIHLEGGLLGHLPVQVQNLALPALGVVADEIGRASCRERV